MAEEGAGGVDDALVESVQRGLTPGMVQQGRLPPRSERLSFVLGLAGQLVAFVACPVT